VCVPVGVSVHIVCGFRAKTPEVIETLLGFDTQGDSDVISFHVYASWFSPPF